MRLVSLPLLVPALALAAFCAVQPPAYLVTTVAGSDLVGDAGPAVSAQLGGAEGVAADAAGNVYISDSIDHRVRKVTPAGIISTVAGNGHPGLAGDGGPASAALLNRPYGLAVDASGSLYIADLGNLRVRRVSPDGVIRTVAGGGQSRPGALEALATHFVPRNVAIAPDGSLYISAFAEHRIFRVAPDGRIFHVAGTGDPGSTDHGDLATRSQLSSPAGIAVDASGNLYVADSGNNRVRKIVKDRVQTILGGEKNNPSLSSPTSVALDSFGNLYVADSGKNRIRKLTPNGAILTVASTSDFLVLPGGVALSPPRDLAVDAAGNLYSAAITRVQRILPTGLVLPFAGSGAFGYRGDGQPALEAHLFYPRSIALDASGHLYIADQRNSRVRRVSPDGVISTVAGNGQRGNSGDGGPAVLAAVDTPSGLAAGASGNLWIASEAGNTVRRVTREGLIVVTAGTGARGSSGDSGPAALAQFSLPQSLALDSSGNLYVADQSNHRIRRISPDGIVTNFAGLGARGYGGDGGLATEAQMDSPTGLAFDSAGNLYVSEYANHCVRRITPSGIIETVAGSGRQDFLGDGAPALAAALNHPTGIALDRAGNLYIADTDNQRIRVVTTDGVIHTIAGSGTAGFAGDGGYALSAQFYHPTGVAVDADGNVFIADFENHRIRKLSIAPAIVPPEPIVEQPLTVANAASLAAGRVAPGMVVTILGAGLGPETPASAVPDASGAYSPRLEGVEVLFDGAAVPVLFAHSTQVRAQVPYRVSGQATTRVQVFDSGVSRGGAVIAVVAAAPGLFTLAQGKGQAVALHEDGGMNSESNPCRRGSVVTLYATGEGLTSPPAADGRLPREPLPKPVLPIRLTIGGYSAEILFAAAAPDSPGVLQLNVRVPSGYVPSGLLPVILTVGTAESQSGVYLAVQ